MDSVEPPFVKAGGNLEMKDAVNEDTKIVPADPASSRPCVKHCTRSRFIYHPSSFSYKRMLPFLMENDISYQDGDRAKLQTVPEEKQLTSDESDVMASYGAEDQKIQPSREF